MKREPTISEILADMGVAHESDANSQNTMYHRLYYTGKFIGLYSAHQVADLLREHGLDDPEPASTNSDGRLSRGKANVGDRIGRSRRPVHLKDTISGGPIGPSDTLSLSSQNRGTEA